MDRSSQASAVPQGIHLIAISAAAAVIGVAAGAALVYWGNSRRQSDSNDDTTSSVGKTSHSNSTRNNVPLFDSVQGWLRANSGSSPMDSLLDTTRSSMRSGRSVTLSGPPPTVPEGDESQAEEHHEEPVPPRSRRELLPLSDWEIPEEDIEICKRPDGGLWHLGAGSYGQVFKAMRGGVQPVAVKVFPSNATDVQMAEFQKEVVILKSCRDRNIVQFLGACITDTQTCLVTEYMEGGDLFNALRRDRKGSLTWYKKRDQDPHAVRPAAPVPGLGKRIALDITRGLHFLHTHRIVHMDVKTPNVLLGRNHVAKLADVGLAKFLHKDYLSAARSVGTFAWSAPEVLMGGRCSEKVDIFSLGVVLWELVTGESPARGRLRPVKVPEECSEAIQDLIAACMEADPADRPSAREVVEMLSQDTEKQLPCGRRSRKPEVGAASGRALDELVRHANVLGLRDYTRSDALTAAEYRDDFALYKRYVSLLKENWGEDGEPPEKGTPQHAQILKLVDSFRQMLSVFLAEHTDTARELRNVDLRNAGRKEGSEGSKPAHPDPGASTLGKREEGVDWRPVLQAMRLSPAQAAAIVDARSQVTVKVEELTRQRRELIASLQSLALGPSDDAYGCAVDKTDELRRNMNQEGIIQHEYHYWFFSVALTPLQEAAVEIEAFPFFPDAIALSELLVRDAIAAMANARHSADVSGD